MGKDLKGKELGKGISQRKDGRYEARATINGIKIDLYDTNLSKLRKNFQIAKDKLSVDENDLRPNVTLSEWYTEWFETCKSPQLKSIPSRKTYDRRARNTYCKILGNKLIKDISQIDIQKSTNELIENGYKDKTVKEALGIIRECMDVAIVNHIIKTNPCVGINVKTNNVQHERRVLDHWEQDLFIEEVKNDYYYEAYMVLLLTGMRIGEFSGLQWEDIDFEKKIIKINRSMTTAYVDGKKIEELTSPKTFNSYRTIPFFADIESYLKSWRVKQDEYKQKLGERWRADPKYGNLVFTSTMGSPVTRYVIVHDIQKVTNNLRLKEVELAAREGRPPREIKRIHPHAFRHTFATRCFEKDMNPLFVQSIMGHANYATTVSYTHVLDKVRQQEIEKASNFLS